MSSLKYSYMLNLLQLLLKFADLPFSLLLAANMFFSEQVH